MKTLPIPTDIYELYNYIGQLHDKGAYHKRRGFSLKDTTPLLCTNHLIEESAELQAEACLGQDRDKLFEEAGDVLAVFFHYLWIEGIDLDDLVGTCHDKLEKTFVLDESDIESDNPGFLRRNRND